MSPAQFSAMRVVTSEEIRSGWAPVGCLNCFSPSLPPPLLDPVTVLSSLVLLCSCLFFSSSIDVTASLAFVLSALVELRFSPIPPAKHPSCNPEPHWLVYAWTKSPLCWRQRSLKAGSSGAASSLTWLRHVRLPSERPQPTPYLLPSDRLFWKWKHSQPPWKHRQWWQSSQNLWVQNKLKFIDTWSNYTYCKKLEKVLKTSLEIGDITNPIPETMDTQTLNKFNIELEEMIQTKQSESEFTKILT